MTARKQSGAGHLMDFESTQPTRFYRLRNMLGVGVVLSAIASGLATFFILTGLTDITPSPKIVIALMLVNVALVTALIGIITWHGIDLWAARRRNTAGARLHIRLVTLFSIVAAMPALLVAVFASVTLDRGLDAWFSTRTRTIVDNSVSVAQAYIQEHGQVIRIDAASMAANINQLEDVYNTDRGRFRRILIAQAGVRGLAAAYLIDSNSRVLIEVTTTQEPPITPFDKETMAKAAAGEVVVIAPGESNRVRAIARLDQYEDEVYLLVHRYVDPRVLSSLRNAIAGKSEYDSLESRRSNLQITFALMYIGVALIFLLASIWFGIWVADRLVRPITRLVQAAEKVSEGELDVSVPVRREEGDLATLGQTFNRMTEQLRTQHQDLLNANSKLDERRRFTETVLSGVSAGVIGLDKAKKINLVNRSASKLLGATAASLNGKKLSAAVPEFSDILDRAFRKAGGSAHGQVALRRDGTDHIFTVRVTTERGGRKIHGYVVTFDEITELVTAQRNSAWADIARRIAHEIKNPLTPIQLSAERLRRKYGQIIDKDREIFEQCTDTIIRQVGDIGRMVDEFSSFARMPKAVLEFHDVGETVREAVFLQQVSQGDIELQVNRPETPISANIDRRLIAQAVTNLVKNAMEAIGARRNADPEPKGRITVDIYGQGQRVIVDVIDNGIGLPKENRPRLVEPYMTTREKGTGLGLAIVKKIMEEHGGRLILMDAPGLKPGQSGALVRLELPIGERDAAPAPQHSETAGGSAKKRQRKRVVA